MLGLVDAHRDNDFQFLDYFGTHGPEGLAEGLVLVAGEVNDHIVVAVHEPVAVRNLVIATARNMGRGVEVGLFGVRFDCLGHRWASRLGCLAWAR